MATKITINENGFVSKLDSSYQVLGRDIRCGLRFTTFKFLYLWKRGIIYHNPLLGYNKKPNDTISPLFNGCYSCLISITMNQNMFQDSNYLQYAPFHERSQLLPFFMKCQKWAVKVKLLTSASFIKWKEHGTLTPRNHDL